MNGIPIKDIKEALIAELPVPELKEWGKIDEHMIAKYCAEHGNAVIRQQGQVKIGLNREKLARRLMYSNPLEHKPDTKTHEVWELYLKQADAIIADQKDLFEVVK